MRETRKKLSELLELTWDMELSEFQLKYARERLRILKGTGHESKEKNEVLKLEADITDMTAQFNRIKKEL